MANKLKLQDNRDYFKPFHYPWAYDRWLKHEQSHWLHTEVPMLEDIKDWKNRLSQEEKYFLKTKDFPSLSIVRQLEYARLKNNLNFSIFYSSLTSFL